MGGRGSGRPGRPNHLKIVQGERPDRINYDEPQPEPIADDETLECPFDLSEGAQEVWDRLAPDMVAKGVLTAWDLDQFAILCDSIAIYHECKELMAGKYTAMGAAGGVIKSPYWQIMRDCQGTITSIGSRYGLTPSDRASLTIEPDKGDAGSSPERLLS